MKNNNGKEQINEEAGSMNRKKITDAVSRGQINAGRARMV